MLDGFVRHFSHAMLAVDREAPRAVGRNGRMYQPGIGPHGEREAVELTVQRMRTQHQHLYNELQTQVTYPGSQQKCDILWTTNLTSWAIEVKMIRFRGDNGKLADLSVQDILSPYEADHSAVADCLRLSTAAFRDHKAVLLYAFDDPQGPQERRGQ